MGFDLRFQCSMVGALLLLFSSCNDAFSLHAVQPRFSSDGATTFLHARSICTFDETDFSGAAGDATALELSSASFNRLDGSDDAKFYKEPRFVNHIDDNAIECLKKFYWEEFKDSYKGRPLDILDLCSSWTSHFPHADGHPFEYGRVVGLGMNHEELDANDFLTETIVQDLNKNPSMKENFSDGEVFDIISMAVSVDYLIEPISVFKEIHRLLKPETGKALISFSNRCFPSKAIAYWLQADDLDRLTLVASYFHYSSGRWSTLEAFDLKDIPTELPKRPSAKELFSNPAAGMAWMNSVAAIQQRNNSDPMFVLKGVKQ